MKKIAVLLMLASSLFAFGCGRNAQFGTVDMQRVEAEAPVVKTVKDEATKELQKLQDELKQETEGKSKEEGDKILEEKMAKRNVIQSEAQNKLKSALEGALQQVAKEKNLSAIIYKDVVPQGGVDVTDDVIAKMN